jgi:Mg2+ and Co2+ transporter CorA
LTWLIIILSILIVATILGIYWISNIIKTLIDLYNKCEVLMDTFIEVNQNYYEMQSKIAKQITIQSSDLANDINALKKNTNSINNTGKSLAEITMALKDSNKATKQYSDELRVSKDIASNLATVSSNLKILDKVVSNLKKTIEQVGRKNANK